MTPSPRDRLDAILAGAARRERDRRLVTGLTVLGLLLVILGASVAVWPFVGPRLGASADLASAVTGARPLLLLLPILVVVASLLPGLQRVSLARRLDRLGGLEDRVTTAVALVAGRTSARLGEDVIADAARALAADPHLLERAFPRRPRPLALRLLRIAAGVLVVLVLVAGLAALLPALPGTGSGSRSGSGPGPAAPPPPTSSGGPGAGGPEDAPDPQPGDDDAVDAATAPIPPTPGSPDADPARGEAVPPAPLADVGLSVLGGPHRVGRRVLVSVRAVPAAGLAADAALELQIVVDEKPLRTGAHLALAPGRPDGATRVVIVSDLPGSSEVLGAGDHVAVAMLIHSDGRTVVSAPVPFRIEGDARDDGGGAGGVPPPPPDASDSPPPQAPPSAPPPPEAADGGGDPPGEPDVPEPDVTDRVVVVPLFGDGEAVKKTGSRLVLTPGGRPVREDSPEPTPDPVAIDDAVRRAEAAVDRDALSAEDRALVLRYLDALRARAAAAREGRSR